MRPRCCAIFCDGYEVGAEEYGGYPIDAEELGGEGRRVGRLECGAGSQIFEEWRGKVLGENSLVRFEFEGLSTLVGAHPKERGGAHISVRCILGLYEYRAP